MMLAYSVIALCVVVWYCSRQIANAIEKQNRSTVLVANAIENQNRGTVPAGKNWESKPNVNRETALLELQVLLRAMHRILLDSLKPDWGVKFKELMGNFEKDQGVKDADMLEGRVNRINRERKFIEEMRKLPLHIVDQRLWDLIEQARKDHETAGSIIFLIKKERDSITEEDREFAKTLLRESEETLERGLHPKIEARRIGQGDLVEWFHVHITSLFEERYYWNSKLRELIQPIASQ
jgi:hypothetical protein